MNSKYRTLFTVILTSSLLINAGTPFFLSDDTVLAETEEVISEEREGQENITVSASVNRAFHYNDHALLDVEIVNDSDLSIDRIEADVSELGGSESLSISPELNRVALSVDYTVEPGDYTIPVTVWDEDNGYYSTETEVTILPREKEEGDVDWDQEIIYFMLTDRFADGDPSNNNPYGLNYEEASNDRGVYQGGDFQGVTDNLEYLDDLGITTIWLTPIVENVAHDVEYDSNAGTYYAYHGYWANDFEELNPHLGTLAEFHTLIDEAADRNIKIMVDVVLNHTGYGLNPDDGVNSPPEGYPTDEDRERFGGMIRENPGRDDETMELSGLPDFETENSDVRNQLVDWQSSWIERSTTPNGNAIASYRVDTVKHVDRVTWQHFKNELVEKDPSFKLIGESWGAAYQNTQGYLNSGTMDSLLDFGFKDIASSFVSGRLERANQQLMDRNDILTSQAILGQFLGSHDEAGFLFTHRSNEGLLKLAASLQLTAKGQPVIYYGEELGQSGAENWPVYDNRYDFGWDLIEDNDILEHYQQLTSFRNDFSEILSRGDRHLILGSDEDEWIMVERSLDDESVYMLFNVSEEAQSINFRVDNDSAVVINHYSQEVVEVSDSEFILSVPSIADGGTALLTIEDGNLNLSQEAEMSEEELEIEETTDNSSNFFSRIINFFRNLFN